MISPFPVITQTKQTDRQTDGVYRYTVAPLRGRE